MAKNMQPIAKRCKALGISPAEMGYAKKTTNRNPGGQMRKKKSEYGLQLAEKQKVKFIYGVLEKQFHAYYESAAAASGKTGDNLLILVERRLDNVVYRMGLAATRRQARQLVSHAHFTVNGKKVNIPSYLVKAGDVIEVAESSRSSELFKRLTGEQPYPGAHQGHSPGYGCSPSHPRGDRYSRGRAPHRRVVLQVIGRIPSKNGTNCKRHAA